MRFCLVHACLALLALLIPTVPARAMIRFDFEQKFFVHPEHQVWDFSMVRPDSVYHIFYHAIPDATPSAARGDTIWHAHSRDLKHWQIDGPVVAVSAEAWEQGAVWAPDVFYDDAGGRWTMAYTSCDAQINQRIALAVSDDLFFWTKADFNPVLEPDPLEYLWDPDGWWSDFRDPFVWREQGLWHILVAARKWYTSGTGILFHATSPDLVTWTDQGPFFINDGADSWRVPESPQYQVIGSWHHLFFGEYDTGGISLISETDPGAWTMADRVMIETGSYAPEVDSFDPGVRLFSRITPFHLPESDSLTYVVRIDTLFTGPDGSAPAIYKPHPLDEHWALHTGIVFDANPTFGDNPLWRGEPSVGMVGNGYFSSQEYYQGPLSGKGAPGVSLGDAALGRLESRPFVITGDMIELLVGGGDYPGTCYVALVAVADSTILFSETGGGQERMTLRRWDVRQYTGVTCFIRIVDDETGPMGHINVDEITEKVFTAAAAPSPPDPGPVATHRAAPNPFNPGTTVSFTLTADAAIRLRILDLRGREVWTGPRRLLPAGPGRLSWRGRDNHGLPAGSGTYLYILEADGRRAAAGKISLLK